MKMKLELLLLVLNNGKGSSATKRITLSLFIWKVSHPIDKDLLLSLKNRENAKKWSYFAKDKKKTVINSKFYQKYIHIYFITASQKNNYRY